MLNPIYVDNWKMIKERWEAFWNFDYIDRPILQIMAPKNERKFDPVLEEENNNPEKKHGDYEHILKYGLYKIENTRYIAEAIPVITPCSSVGHALYFGCKAVYDKNSMWCESLPCEEDGLPHPVFSEDNYWYKWYHDALEYFAQKGNGSYYTLPTFGNHSADTLGLIRGIENLMCDIIDRPDWVKTQDRQIADVLIDIINERFLDVEKNKVEGYLNDASMWAPKRQWGLHCDISYMLSTDDFKELFWESQKRLADMTDYAYFHVDGPGVLRHIDLILADDRIQTIQWLPGDGRNHPMEWIDVYRKVQEKGRSLQIFAEYDDVLPILNEIKPNGVCINVINCPGEDDGYRILEEVEKFYRKK